MSDMALIFEFGDGSPHDKSAIYDTRTSNLGGWTKEDFVYAINVYQRAFGSRETNTALFKLFGVTDPARVPTYAYGQIIAALAESMSCGRKHNITRSPLYAGKNQ
jgi:hypothetical protein